MDLKPIELYIDWASQPSRAVVSLCLMAKIPYILKETRVLQGEQRTDEFSKINPDRKVPAIRDPENGFSLFESHAIMRYLANSSSIPDNFYPKDYILRAKVDAYLDWHHNNTRKAGWLIFNLMVAPQLGLKPYIDLTILRKDVQKAIDFIEMFFLKDKQYIHGLEEISIADISCYCELIQLKFINFSFDNYPNISLWMIRVGSIPEIQQTHLKFNTFVKKIQEKQKQGNAPKL